MRRGVRIDLDQWDEIILLLNRLATALEHTHKCEQEISKTLKSLEKIHKSWFKKGVGIKTKTIS